MELIRGIHNIRDKHHGCVLTIGNFDGVHLGHREVIKGLLRDAKALNLPSTVMIFEPQPQEFFRKEQAPARLTRLRDKLALLAKLGVERVICVSFNAKFANYEAQDFVRQVLIEKLGVKALTVGDDFRFGHDRAGDFTLLKRIGEQANMAVKNTDSFKKANARVSSTAIRTALKDGKLEQAKDMLGHDYAISGRVIHGWKKGRELGFPTANVALKRQVCPLSGVFAVQVDIAGRQVYGVANVGNKPTFNGTRALLEVHLFDFEESIYGQFIEVKLKHKLRDEQKFNGLDELVQQIQHDVIAAKQFFTLSTNAERSESL
ncbi:bifunctional riboflavin kinase/FAD synthetase [Pseudoalteromonas sp. SSDWG2]|uniref:bifunctional riboflavin kinase/FAD synthetase n=1 Tax=Pseudoalteromonas sp. SSDWG2 TaxID=3139391 RepID=UPI003BAD9C79